jgi:hypothetical protein
MALWLFANSRPHLKPPVSTLAGPANHPETLLVRRQWWREPLLHFLFFGALVFAAYKLLNPVGNGTDQTARIELTKDDLRQLAVHWIAQGRPVPTPDEMRVLVEQKVNEEILFREAIALGLDKGDEMIKRRLAQKMAFLAEDIAALQGPATPNSESGLRSRSVTWQAHAGKYRSTTLMRPSQPWVDKGICNPATPNSESGLRTRSVTGKRMPESTGRQLWCDRPGRGLSLDHPATVRQIDKLQHRR